MYTYVCVFLFWDILGHPGMSAVLYTTAESQAYVSLLYWDILGHHGMSAVLYTTAESQAYVSLLYWDILGHPTLQLSLMCDLFKLWGPI